MNRTVEGSGGHNRDRESTVPGSQSLCKEPTIPLSVNLCLEHYRDQISEWIGFVHMKLHGKLENHRFYIT